MRAVRSSWKTDIKALRCKQEGKEKKVIVLFALRLAPPAQSRLNREKQS